MAYREVTMIEIKGVLRQWQAGAKHKYGDECEVRRVRTDGTIKWRGRHTYVSEALRRQTVGLGPLEEGSWAVLFGPLTLGSLDERGNFHRVPAVRRSRRRPR